VCATALTERPHLLTLQSMVTTRYVPESRRRTRPIRPSAFVEEKAADPFRGQRQGRAQGEGEARQEDHAACLTDAGKSALRAPFVATSILIWRSMLMPFDFQR